MKFRAIKSVELLLCLCLVLIKSTFVCCNWIETPAWLDELFGDGDFNSKSSQMVQKHLSRQECQ